MKYSVYVWVVCCLLVGEIYAYLPVRFSGRLINTATTHTTGPNIGYNPNTATTSGRIIPQHPSTHRSPISTTSLFGIPKLFRWLVDLYPLVVDSVGNGISSNSMKIDNFYLDMNGIIHACTHSNNDGLIDFNEEDMFIRIFKYTDRLYKLVRPKKMMYLAVDGVAPRAKMNQQRSRRFRSSKEREALIAEFVAKEGKMPDNESFDSNCITPGTEFMHRLGIAFNKWIEYQMTHDPFWQQQGATVYFSGPDVPGEGEHKIMDKIRAQQASGIAIGSEVHCMYGLDADLIMLSLASHEPYFMLLREKISKKSTQKDALSYQPEDFEVLEVSVLRSMLKVFFKPIEELADTTVDGKKLPSFSIERVIDDFVFM